jgi:transcriptional regulator with XRE-family HTH domain
MTFCEKVLQEIKEKGLKKSELAHAINIPYTTLDSMLRRNSDNISLPVVFKIAEFLNVSVDYLAYEQITDKQYKVDQTVETNQQNYEHQIIIKKIEKLNSFGCKILSAYIDGLLMNKDYAIEVTKRK